MFSIVIMDPDNYIKYGLGAYLKPKGVRVLSALNIKDLNILLRKDEIDVVVMDLSNGDDDVFDSIEFVRIFTKRWPKTRLIIYTQRSNVEAVKLLIAVTDQKMVFFKNDNILRLTTCLFSSNEDKIINC